jgi:hypothetical protein
VIEITGFEISPQYVRKSQFKVRAALCAVTLSFCMILAARGTSSPKPTPIKFLLVLVLADLRGQQRFSRGIGADQPGRGTYAANDSSPAIWWCAGPRPRASATARWSTIRRTDAGIRDHVINYRRMDVGDPMMMFGRSPYRKCGANNNCSGKRNFCLAEHFLSLG